jgi:hypothetical protein
MSVMLAAKPRPVQLAEAFILAPVRLSMPMLSPRTLVASTFFMSVPQKQRK